MLPVEPGRELSPAVPRPVCVLEVRTFEAVVRRRQLRDPPRIPHIPGFGELVWVGLVQRDALRYERRPEVDLADAVSPVPILPERLGERRNVVVELYAVHADAMAPGVEASEHGRPGRGAERVGDVGAGEVRSAGGQCVEVRRSHQRVARVPEARRIVLVGRDDEEVGPSRFGHGELAQPQAVGRYCSASPRWEAPMTGAPARSARVRATLSMRW